MSWVITKDHMPLEELGFPSRVGRGEGWLTKEPGARSTPGYELTSFKLYDDDGDLIYEGRMTLERLNGDESQAFAPLNWAMADVGCTELRYRDPITKVWRTL